MSKVPFGTETVTLIRKNGSDFPHTYVISGVSWHNRRAVSAKVADNDNVSYAIVRFPESALKAAGLYPPSAVSPGDIIVRGEPYLGDNIDLLYYRISSQPYIYVVSVTDNIRSSSLIPHLAVKGYHASMTMEDALNG